MVTKQDEIMKIALRKLQSAADSDNAWFNLENPRTVLDRMRKLLDEAYQALDDNDTARAMHRAIEAGGAAVAGFAQTYFRDD